MFLVDTSAWIRHFSAKDAFDLRQICSPDERVLCLPVYQEILQGVRDEAAFRTMRTIMQAALIVETPLRHEVFDAAVDLYRLARRHGLTVRSSVDCIVAVCAIRHSLTVLHDDRDYGMLAKVSALQEQSVG